MKKKRYIKLKGENVIISLTIFFIIAALVTGFIGQAMLQSSNSELQRLKTKIETQEKLNASIQMKINELASLDNALKVADNYGLEYNNDNIRVISE